MLWVIHPSLRPVHHPAGLPQIRSLPRFTTNLFQITEDHFQDRPSVRETVQGSCTLFEEQEAAAVTSLRIIRRTTAQAAFLPWKEKRMIRSKSVPLSPGPPSSASLAQSSTQSYIRRPKQAVGNVPGAYPRCPAIIAITTTQKATP